MKNLHTFLVLIVLICSQYIHGQVSTYTFSQSTGTYTEITGGTVIATATATSGVDGLDDVIYSLPNGTIPFNFFFNGTPYTGFNISSNGFITFGITQPTTTTYTPISATVAYSGAISAVGRDLIGRFGFIADRTTGSDVLTNVNSFVGVQVGQLITGTGIPTGTTILSFDTGAQTVTMSAQATSTATGGTYVVPTGTIRYEVLGSAPNRVFVIQWKKFSKFTGPGDEFNFQIRLYEANSTAEVVYGGFVSNATNASPQVGLRGLTNADYNNRTTTTDWTASTPGATNSANMTLTSTVFPPSGLTFTWTSPNFGPAISYNNLSNTSLFGNRNLDDAVIIDPDGVAGGVLAPRVYWRVNQGTWQSAGTISGSSPYDFVIGTTGLSVGDTVYYFVAAQDVPGLVTANPSEGFSATDVNTILTYPTSPNFYLITSPPLAGDYTVGLALFRSMSGKDITFEKRVRSLEIEEITYESNASTGNSEINNAFDVTLSGTNNIETESIKEVLIKRTIEQEYYVPILNGQEYTGSLYHEFTPEQISQNNLDSRGVYSTIGAAVSDLSLRGVSGPVRFLLVDANYPSETFPVVIGSVNGASLTNTITILPQTGVTPTITGAVSLPLFDLNPGSFIIFDGRQNGVGTTNSLTIHNTSTATGARCIRLINGASNNTLQYVNFIGMPSASVTSVIEFSTSALNPGGNSNNLITNCDLNGGRYGIWYNGTAANPNTNNVVRNSKIYDATFSQFYMLAGSNNSTIEGNEIYSVTPQTTANSAINMLAAGLGGVNNIIGNKIYDIQNTSTSTLRGISGTPGEGSTLNIINNFISLTNDNGTKTSIYAIQISGTTSHTANIYFNTMRLGGVHTGGSASTIVSGGLIKSNTGATATFNAKNNISVNSRTGGTAGVFHTNFFVGGTGIVGTLDINYNVWFASGDASSFHSGWNGFLYNDQQAYRDSAAPYEQNSIFYNVNFVSNTDLHVAGASIGDTTLSGLPIAGITTDIDGDTRDLVRPYRGADEGDTPLPVELSSFNAVISGNGIKLTWSTSSENNNRGFEVERQIDNAWQSTGFVDGNGTTTSESQYSYVDNFDFRSVKGTVSYRLKQIDFDGSFHYSNVVNVDVDFTPKEFSLYQNYPNPFNPSTRIKYAIPVNSIVKVIVYNLLGEVVSELVNSVQETGYYDVVWNANDMASGLYFYTIQAKSVDGAKDFTSVKKMMLVK